jgi:acetoin utilization protein AcuB
LGVGRDHCKVTVLLMSKPTFLHEIMTTSVTTLPHDGSLLNAALLMRQTDLRHLPVVKNGAVIGLLSDRDVNRAAPSRFGPLSQEEYNQIFKNTPIEKVMTKDPYTAPPDTPVRNVVHVPCERKIGAGPVVTETGALVGIVTRADLLDLLQSLLP